MITKDESKSIIPEEFLEIVLDPAKNATLECNLAPTNKHVIEAMTYLQSIKSVGAFAAPFTLSRVAVAVNVIANGFVIARLGGDASAAGPIMVSSLYSILTACAGVLLSTGILIGKLHGEVEQHLQLDNLEEAQLTQKEIGHALRQSFVLSIILAIPSVTAMLMMSQLLEVSGISSEIALQAQQFLTGTTAGVLPMYWSICDQQFAMATGHPNLPLITGLLYVGLSMAIGYPLALGGLGLVGMGPAGLGYGMAVAGWVSFLGLRAYFLREQFKPYALYDPRYRNFFNGFSDFFTLGIPLGAQALSEWGNLTILSTLVGLSGKRAAIASLGSFEIISSVSLMSGALGQAVSVKIANLLGEMSILEKQGLHQEMAIQNDNIKITGNSALIIGVVANIILSAFMAGCAHQINSLLISSEYSDDNYVKWLAQIMMYTNAIGLIFDTIRTLAGGALGGSKDVIFASVVSLITISLVGLTCGGLLTNYAHYNANFLFITRNAGIVLAAVMILAKWYIKDHIPEATNEMEVKDENLSLTRAKPKSYFNFFKNQPDLPINEDTAVIEDITALPTLGKQALTM